MIQFPAEIYNSIDYAAWETSLPLHFLFFHPPTWPPTQEADLVQVYDRMYEKSTQIRNRSLFREAPQCTRFFIKIKCFGTFNVEWTGKNEKFKTSTPGELVVSFTTS